MLSHGHLAVKLAYWVLLGNESLEDDIRGNFVAWAFAGGVE